MARAALKDIQIFNPYVNQNGSFNAYSYYDHGVESQENFRNAFPVTDQCERSAQLMGDDYVRLKFNLTAYVPMAAFSFIRYDGQTFFLMNDYCPHSNGSRMEHDQQGNEMVVSDSYEYDMKFYSVANMLRKPICYRHVKVAKGATAADGYHEWDEPEVTVSATLETMYVIIVQSIEQYTSRLDSDFLLTRMLATIPTNGLDNTGIAPKNTVKLTAGTELATFNFNGEKIADVCTAVANTYSDAKKETEWYIEEDAEHSLTLHFCKCVDTGSMNHADDFSYKKTEGVDRYTKPIKTGGLKKVDYSRDESNIPQVIIPFGSERNMTYQAVKGIDEVSQMQSTFGKRLRLKTNHTCTINGTQYPTAAMQAKGITGAYAVTDKDGNTVPLGVDAHGGIANDKVNTGVEKVEYFDDVYPQCHFQVSKVDVRNKKKDGATIPEYTCEGKVVNAQGQEIQPEGDFYPLQIEEGKTLSVRFESGYLNGREFEIANKTQKKTNPSTGQPETNYTLRFVIVADGSIEDGTLIPSGNFKPRARVAGGYEGDKFALFNMKMPEAYITYAQEELAQKAYEKLMEYQDTVPDVKCTSDPDSFGGKDVYFGAQYTINSEKLGFTLNEQNRRVPVDFISRVVAYSYKLTKVNEVSFTLSSALVRGVLSEMAAAITNVSYATEGLGQRSINLSRRGWRDASEVADMITSMNTEMMLVGNEKYQFQYTSEILPLHTNGVFTGLKVSYGQLQHTQQPYIDYANGGLWQIQPNASLNADYQGNALDGTKPYYVFAVCGTDNLEWATVILMDKDAAETNGVYHKDAEISDEDQYPQYLLLGILSSEFAEEKDGQMTYERVFSPTNGFTAIEGGTITTEQIQDANRQLIIDFQSYPPRIIARGGAEIIGNITFKSFKDANGNEVTVGSRNLLRGTDWFDTDHYTGGVLGINDTLWSSARWRAASTTTGRETTVHTFSSGKPIPSISTYVKIKLTAAQSGWVDIAQDSVSPVKKGKTYMLSVYAKATTAAAAKIHLGAWTNSTGTVHSKADVSQDLTSSWKRYTFMFMWEWDEVPNIYFGLVGGAANDTLELCGMQLEESAFVSDWRPANEDTDSAIAEAQENASDALEKANNMADDGIISGGTEKSTIKKEWQEIAGSNYDATSTDGSYYKAKQQAAAYGVSTSTLESKFIALKTMLDAILADMSTDYVLANGDAQWNTKDKFIAKWRDYYDAEIALLNAVSDVIDTREIGGENLLYVKEYYDNQLTCEEGNVDSYYEELTYYSGSGASRQHTYYPAGKYVFSANDVFTDVTDYHADVRLYIAAFNSSGQEVAAVLIPAGTSSNRASVRDVLITTNASCYFCLKIVCDGTNMLQYCQGSAKASNMQLQKGVKSTSYNNYMEHLSNAIKGTTDIFGGLLMTNVMMLKNEHGAVTAGMSGLTEDAQGNDEPILMWGGANYQQALEAALPKAGQTLPDYKYTDGAVQKLITTLLRKDGTGKIGCFYVEGDKAIVETTDGKVVIDDNEGISILDSSGKEKVLVTPKPIDGYISSAGSGGNMTGHSVFDLGPVSASSANKKSYIGQTSSSVDSSGVIPQSSARTFEINKSNNKVYVELEFGGSIGATNNVPQMNLYVQLENVTTGNTYYSSSFALLYNSSSCYGSNIGKKTFTFTSLAQGTYRIAIVTSGVNPSISAQISYYNFNAQATMTYDNIDPKTVVGSNGLLSVWSNRSMFAVKNISSEQRIICQGLPTSDPHVAGQLYAKNDDHILRVSAG